MNELICVLTQVMPNLKRYRTIERQRFMKLLIECAVLEKVDEANNGMVLPGLKRIGKIPRSRYSSTTDFGNLKGGE